MENGFALHKCTIKIGGGKKMKYILFYLVIFLTLNSCSFQLNQKNVVRIVGSDTMFELTSLLAEEFMKEHSNISIYIKGGGTAEGIKSLIKNECEICSASRNLKPDEAKELAEYYGSLGLVFLIAKDALSIYLNKDNNVKCLTSSQLKNIYKGEIKNWKELGGADTLISVVTRNPNSGTYLYFKDHILEGENYMSDAIIKSTTKDVVKFVAENVNAIGYGGMSYAQNIIHSTIDGVEPNEINVRNDTYPITRYLHFFTTKTPGGAEKKFIDWVLSPKGQRIVRKAGFIPLWE